MLCRHQLSRQRISPVTANEAFSNSGKNTGESDLRDSRACDTYDSHCCLRDQSIPHYRLSTLRFDRPWLKEFGRLTEGHLDSAPVPSWTSSKEVSQYRAPPPQLRFSRRFPLARDLLLLLLHCH